QHRQGLLLPLCRTGGLRAMKMPEKKHAPTRLARLAGRLLMKEIAPRGEHAPITFFLTPRRMLMSRRRTLASLAALAAVLALLARVPVRADEKAAHPHEMHYKCSKACFDCSRECASCFHHCAHLVADGKKEHTKTLHLCNDCATICAAAGEVSG